MNKEYITPLINWALAFIVIGAIIVGYIDYSSIINSKDKQIEELNQKLNKVLMPDSIKTPADSFFQNSADGKRDESIDYNQLLDDYSSLIIDYNSLVGKYNEKNSEYVKLLNEVQVLRVVVKKAKENGVLNYETKQDGDQIIISTEIVTTKEVTIPAKKRIVPDLDSLK